MLILTDEQFAEGIFGGISTFIIRELFVKQYKKKKHYLSSLQYLGQFSGSLEKLASIFINKSNMHIILKKRK